MIYALYLNPTIDKTIYIDNFGIGETNRVQETITQGGGKALNLAKVLDNLGIPVTIVGINTIENSKPINDVIGSIPTKFIMIDDEPRTNIKVVDKVNSVTTEINDLGPEITDEMLDEVKEMLLSTVREDDFVVLTGSLPRNCRPTYYGELTEALGCKVVLDASGKALQEAMKYSPYMIKPNLDELNQLTGKTYSFDNLQMIIDDTRSILNDRTKLAIVSMGKDGALAVDRDSCYYSKPVVAKPDSTVGAGDSMLAGAISVLYLQKGIMEALKVGTASSAATISLPGTTLAGKEDVENMLGKVELEEIR